MKKLDLRDSKNIKDALESYFSDFRGNVEVMCSNNSCIVQQYIDKNSKNTEFKYNIYLDGNDELVFPWKVGILAICEWITEFNLA